MPKQNWTWGKNLETVWYCDRQESEGEVLSRPVHYRVIIQMCRFYHSAPQVHQAVLSYTVHCRAVRFCNSAPYVLQGSEILQFCTPVHQGGPFLHCTLQSCEELQFCALSPPGGSFPTLYTAKPWYSAILHHKSWPQTTGLWQATCMSFQHWNHLQATD